MKVIKLAHCEKIKPKKKVQVIVTNEKTLRHDMQTCGANKLSYLRGRNARNMQPRQT
jgi:hypothetical protein